MTLTSSVKLQVDATQDSAIDLGPRQARPSLSSVLAFANGTGAASADLIFTDNRTLTASATENLDVAGSLTDAFGATITMARVKAIIVRATATNTNDVQLTRPATNGVPFLMAAGDGIALKPGAIFVWADPGATGVAVTAATADLITVTNSAAGTSVSYDVIIIGASA